MNAPELIPETALAASAAAYIPVPFTVIPTKAGTFALFIARGNSRIFIGFFDVGELADRLAENYSDTVRSYNSVRVADATRAAKPKPKPDLGALDLDLSTLDLDLSTL